MRVELDRVKSNGAFEHAYAPAELDLDDDQARLTGSPVVVGRVSRSGNEVRVRGKVNARAELDCDRCLTSVIVTVETEFDVAYIPSPDRSLGNGELQADDMRQSVFDGEAIDVDELVREQVLLALPSRALCDEECKGLCPVCGKNRNIDACECGAAEVDPRWTALEKLRD
jgi:uncharacterized protein